MAKNEIIEEVVNWFTTVTEEVVEETPVVEETIEQVEDKLEEQVEELTEELEVVEEKLQEIKEEKAKWPRPELSSLWEDELIAQLSKIEGSHIEKNAIKPLIAGLIS